MSADAGKSGIVCKPEQMISCVAAEQRQSACSELFVLMLNGQMWLAAVVMRTVMEVMIMRLN